MNDYTRRRSLLLLSIAASLGVLGAACTKPAEKSPSGNAAIPEVQLDMTGARAALATAASDLVTPGQPLANRNEIARRLNLPADRVSAFDLSAAAPGQLSTAFRAGYICAPGICICDGDADCNDLFSTVCRNPSTGGQCWTNGSKVVCVCSPRAIQ